MGASLTATPGGSLFSQSCGLHLQILPGVQLYGPNLLPNFSDHLPFSCDLMTLPVCNGLYMSLSCFKHGFRLRFQPQKTAKPVMITMAMVHLHFSSQPILKVSFDLSQTCVDSGKTCHNEQNAWGQYPVPPSAHGWEANYDPLLECLVSAHSHIAGRSSMTVMIP